LGEESCTDDQERGNGCKLAHAADFTRELIA